MTIEESGNNNVHARLVYRWHELYGKGVEPNHAKLRADWQLARNQLGVTYLTQYVEDTIMRWNKPQ